MRPIKLGPLSPKTANTTCFNASGFTSTGAAVAPTTLVTDDGLAHLVTLIAPVQATLAGVTFTIVGTDADGNAQTETGITGPASGATVTSTKYFKTIATIQPSATMGGLIVSVGTAAPSLSQTIPLERRSIVGATLDMDISGTINFSLNECFDDIYRAAPSTLRWVALTAFTSKATDITGIGTVASSGVQILTNSVTNGATYTLYISQATQITG